MEIRTSNSYYNDYTFVMRLPAASVPWAIFTETHDTPLSILYSEDVQSVQKMISLKVVQKLQWRVV